MVLHRCLFASLAMLLAGCGQPRPEALQGDVCKSIAQVGRPPYPWPDIWAFPDTPLPASLPAAPTAGLAAPPLAVSAAAQAFRAKLAAQAAGRRGGRRAAG